MVRERFDGSTVRLDNFQLGSGYSYFEGLPPYQRGYGLFVGHAGQRGSGFADIFKSVWRFLKPAVKHLAPVLSEAGKAIGEEGLATTSRVLNDVVKGGNLKEALTTEGREGVANLLRKAESKLQRGRGRKRRRNKKTVLIKPSDLIGKTVPIEIVQKNRKKR
ncbi:MAG TPA: hypothetical protein VFV08_16635, partial [Puia sp.]|nr:hypothetical protein [Puia sp.]